jgi:protein FAM32A
VLEGIEVEFCGAFIWAGYSFGNYPDFLPRHVRAKVPTHHTTPRVICAYVYLSERRMRQSVMADPYTSHSTGKLKLKGVKDSKVSKSSKKKKDKASTSSITNGSDATEQIQDNSVMLKHLPSEPNNDADADTPARTAKSPDQKSNSLQSALEEEDHEAPRKTEAERRWDEARRKRLEERLKREGVKTHKERVQELNKYLSGLSEHHDMPKIGPG